MPKGAEMLFRTAALLAALSLGACDASGDDARLASLDKEIVGNDSDPALTSALEDQILVDPALTQQSNKNAVRPPETPTQAQYPLPAESPAARPAATAPAAKAAPTVGETSGTADCVSALVYNAAWARRLPAGFALYPGARLGEVAGTDRADCRARIVTFKAAAAPEEVLQWYRARAAGAGYSAERHVRQGDHILAGRNARSGGAYYLILGPADAGGSEVALIVNGG